MPSVSKKQQKFMGIVRSIQKGEQPASKFSKDAQDTAKKMKKSSVKKYAKTKHDDLPTKKIKEGAYKSATKNELAQYIINLNNMLAVAKSKKMTNHIKFIQQDIKDVKKALSKKKNESVNEAERDYKDEYKKFQSSTKSKKYRAELNKYNRKKGTYGNGDGKDASHKGGKIVGFEKESKNRGRAEKSRLKKENNMPDFNPIIDEVLDEVFGEYQMNESSKVLKSIENLAKQNKYGNVTGTKMNGKTANLVMKIYNHPKMKKYQKAMEKYTSDELVDMTLKMPKVLGIKENVDEALDPYKDFDGSPKEDYNLNLGAFVDEYQKFLKFMKKHKEVPDKNKREWALAIRNKVGQGMFNGHIHGFEDVSDLLSMGDKFRNLKEGVNEAGTKSIDGEELMNFLMKRFKYSKKKAIDVMKKHKMDTSFLKNESVNEAAMELNKIKDAILMFQKKIKKQGRVTNARDEDHLKNLIKLYKKMGGKGVKESVNEGQKKQASMILRKFDMAYIKFSQEVRDVMKLMDKSTGSKVDGKIINKAYGKHLIPFDDLMQSWAKGQQENPGLDEAYDIWMEDGSFGGTFTGLVEAEYQGRKVKLGKPMQGDSKKFKVYVKNPKGNVVKVNFGQGGDAKGGTMRIRKSNPKARANFRARHNCDSPGPRHKARYWSCRKW